MVSKVASYIVQIRYLEINRQQFIKGKWRHYVIFQAYFSNNN